MASSNNLHSVLVVGVIFLVALACMVYMSHFGVEQDREEIIVARIKELESSPEFRMRLKEKRLIFDSSEENGEESTTHSKNKERKSIIDCENMIPVELQGPRFLGTIPNITANRGDNVTIPCVAENLGTYRMAWLKVHSQTILTIHNHSTIHIHYLTIHITKNQRIGLEMDLKTLETGCKNKSIESTIMMYTLSIDSVNEKDEGYYLCQLNTEPLKGQWGFLKVDSQEPTSTTSSSSESPDLSFSSSSSSSEKIPYPTIFSIPS